MWRDVTINKPETLITTSDSGTVEGILFDSNKGIEYLPVNVYEKFPNLIGISAWNCAVKAVTKKNFKNLKQLKFLGLASNHIETIDENTFEDLISLTTLNMRKKILILQNCLLYSLSFLFHR